MKEWAPSVGKTKQPKSDDKFYSDDEDKEEEGSDSSGSEDSSSSGSSSSSSSSSEGLTFESLRVPVSPLGPTISVLHSGR